MSKIIKLSEENINEIRRAFEEELAKAKLSSGQFTFTKKLGAVDRKATLYFTETAYQKQLALVNHFNIEVAWHGVAQRGPDPEKDEYIITDILCHPQTVSSVTVTTDQEEYQNWLYGLDDDVFNNLRMQGHSHVNMGVTPSGTDTSLYDKYLEQLDDTMFYIFLIWNKKGEQTVWIYDMAKNIKFETADVNVQILHNGDGLTQFVTDADAMVKTSTYKYSGTTYGNTQTTLSKEDKSTKTEMVVEKDDSEPKELYPYWDEDDDDDDYFYSRYETYRKKFGKYFW